MGACAGMSFFRERTHRALEHASRARARIVCARTHASHTHGSVDCTRTHARRPAACPTQAPTRHDRIDVASTRVHSFTHYARKPVSRAHALISPARMRYMCASACIARTRMYCAQGHVSLVPSLSCEHESHTQRALIYRTRAHTHCTCQARHLQVVKALRAD